jgi:iron complex transport system substrate-binding protein
MPKLFNEILGDSVEIPEEPIRIASLYPSITETLVELGISERLAGVSAYCGPFVKGMKIPVVSSALSINYKRLEGVKPDFILTSTGIQRNLAIELHRKGYAVFPVLHPSTLYELLSNIVVIGKLVGKQREAHELVEKLSRELEACRVEQQYEERAKIYIEIWPEKYSTTAGGLTFIDDLIYAAGARNIFSETPLTYFTPDFEEVAGANPDLIIFIFENSKELEKITIPSLIADRGWEKIKGVEKNKIVVSLENELPLPHSGPSFVKTIMLLTEKFKAFDVI